MNPSASWCLAPLSERVVAQFLYACLLHNDGEQGVARSSGPAGG